MLMPVIMFIIGLIFLIKGGDWFVDGASGIAKKFNMPEILIGATVVSIGTTLPEVMVSASSALAGHGEIAYGNAIGSIICNTALIAALTVTIVPSVIERKSLIFPAFTFFTAASFYAVIAYVKREFDRVTGFILLIMFIIYMVITVRQAFAQNGNNDDSADKSVNTDNGSVEDKEADKKKINRKELLRYQIFMLIIGAVLIAIGADLLVDNGTIIAKELGVPESVIALTFVALGTSLPELVTAITSLIKKCGALSLGNVIGANIFNIVLVSGVSCTLSPFVVPEGKTIGSMPASLVMDIPVMLFVMLFMVVPALAKGKLYRIQGIILLATYVIFCVLQFVI